MRPGWPLSRQCEIPWQFHDISPMVHGTPADVKCYSYHAGTNVIVSGGGRNAINPKPKWKNAQTQQSQEWMQIWSLQQKVLGHFSLTRFLPRLPDISLTAVKNPRHFHVFHTSGDPECVTHGQRDARPSQPHNILSLWSVPNYTACWQSCV